jgi:hypothetical protein
VPVPEGVVDQGLVTLCLGDLRWCAARPDGLADAAHPNVTAGTVRAEEVAPGGDDPAGVAAEAGHVDEQDAVRHAPEAGHHLLRLAGADRQQDRFTGVHRIPDEAVDPGEEPVLAEVQEGLVTEAGTARPDRCGGRDHDTPDDRSPT